MTKDFDLIVIGGGSAGYAAARTAREHRESVAIVDGAAELGGLCILRGCMPSKTLIYSAEVLHLAQRAKLFGLEIPEARVDMPALHQRKLRMIDDFKSYRQQQLQSDRFTLFRDMARFVDPHTIELHHAGTRISAERFVIATGSRVNTPPIRGIDSVRVWTSDDVLDLDFLPESVIVLGGGVVACELAQFLHRVGARVIQIQRSARVLKDFPADASEVVMRAFRDEGIELHAGTALERIEPCASGVRVVFQKDGRSHAVEATHLVNALGRVPATESLHLANAGVGLAPSGHVATNRWQQTSAAHIYAAGDVAGPHEIVHVAILQGETAARHACGIATAPVDYDTLTGIVFTDPQVAVAGVPLDVARARGIECKVADYPFDDHGKSILMEARYGYVRAWTDAATGRLIGAECVGKDAGELIHALAVGISLKATAADLLKVQWYHPTLSEIWSYPLEDLA